MGELLASSTLIALPTMTFFLFVKGTLYRFNSWSSQGLIIKSKIKNKTEGELGEEKGCCRRWWWSAGIAAALSAARNRADTYWWKGMVILVDEAMGLVPFDPVKIIESSGIALEIL